MAHLCLQNFDSCNAFFGGRGRGLAAAFYYTACTYVEASSARRYLEEGPNLRPNIAMLLEHTAYHPHSSSVTVIDNPLRIRSW